MFSVKNYCLSYIDYKKNLIKKQGKIIFKFLAFLVIRNIL